MNERKIQETIKMSSRARKGEGKKSQWPDYKIRRKKRFGEFKKRHPKREGVATTTEMRALAKLVPRSSL
jgi:hypothetical protein